MAVLGVVAEFNPFHNGHRYFISQARQTHNFDAVICVMSGNFVQRGKLPSATNGFVPIWPCMPVPTW